MHVVLAWVVVASIVAFVLTMHDKRRARALRQRIRERTLLAWALVGGWPGMALAMVLVRHKTRKAAFLGPFLVCTLVNVALVWFVAIRFSLVP